MGGRSELKNERKWGKENGGRSWLVWTGGRGIRSNCAFLDTAKCRKRDVFLQKIEFGFRLVLCFYKRPSEKEQ